MPAKDLTREVPRSPFDELEGYPWLPRMIDKARATFASTSGDYTPYPSPGDRQFLRFFGLKAKDLGELIKSGADEPTIAKYVRSHTKRSGTEIDFFRQTLLLPPSNPLLRFGLNQFLALQIKKLLKAKPGTDASGIDTLAKFLVVEEGHFLP